ncbi:tape measure protein, partial [Niveispirillum fermenti]|uniref:tape measure protein n=1 Tax=Niveispirillum fermenti TaxID=1233113 RepID=UPI003A8750D5
MTDVTDLIIKISADMAGLRGELANAKAEIERFQKRAEQQADGAGKGLAIGLGRATAAVTGLFAALGGLNILRNVATDMAQAGDKAVQMEGRFKVATGSIGAAKEVYRDLLETVGQTGGSIEEAAGQFVRFSLAARDIGATRGEVVKLIDIIGKLGVVAGASRVEASSAATQLAQALASGRLQGDELRSVLETMPTLADLLARNLGVTIGQLRKMGSEGQLTADKVFRGLLAGAEEVDAAFAQMPLTMDRASGNASTAWTRFLAEMD